jgi:hypothetical protein
MADKPKLIKVCLTNRGHDTETPWAEDLGPVEGSPNARRAKIVNVPFLHAKPTWGDVIAVTPGADGVLTWDRDNVPWKAVSSRLLEDGGRWAMIVDYAPRAGTKGGDAFTAFASACESLDIVCEGAWSPKPKEPGRAYLAVRKEFPDHSVMHALRDSKLPCELIQVHPDPRASAKATNGQAETAKPAGAAAKQATPKQAAVKQAAAKQSPAAPPKEAAKQTPAAGTKVPAKQTPAAGTKQVSAKATPAAGTPAVAAPKQRAKTEPPVKAAPAKADKSTKTAVPKPVAPAKSAPVKAAAPAKPASKASKPAPAPAKPAKKSAKPSAKSR